MALELELKEAEASTGLIFPESETNENFFFKVDIIGRLLLFGAVLGHRKAWEHRYLSPNKGNPTSRG